MLEPAIAKHHRRERKVPVKTPPGYEPPFPAYTARFLENVKDLVMAVIGVQYKSKDQDDGQGIDEISSFTHSPSVDGAIKPKFQEVAGMTDNQGYYNIAVLAYWASAQAYHEWSRCSGFGSWWDGIDPVTQSHGWFLEVFLPTMDRFETVFSDNEVPEGAAHLRHGISGQIQEHVYWGSMRDRMPLAQTDSLTGEKYNAKVSSMHATTSRRLKIPGKKNLAIIRSGQDWSDTPIEERRLYLEKIHPTLTTGMHFLRDNGPQVGCYACRFMSIVDPTLTDQSTDRTFGLAYFDDLSSLEKWSKEHPTHLAIFGEFLKYAQTLDNNVSLRLFHEVLVLTPQQQYFEYVGCHGGTGMIAAI